MELQEACMVPSKVLKLTFDFTEKKSFKINLEFG